MILYISFTAESLGPESRLRVGGDWTNAYIAFAERG